MPWHFLVRVLQAPQVRNETVSEVTARWQKGLKVTSMSGVGQRTSTFHWISFWNICFCNHVQVSLIKIYKFFVGYELSIDNDLWSTNSKGPFPVCLKGWVTSEGLTLNRRHNERIPMTRVPSMHGAAARGSPGQQSPAPENKAAALPAERITSLLQHVCLRTQIVFLNVCSHTSVHMFVCIVFFF